MILKLETHNSKGAVFVETNKIAVLVGGDTENSNCKYITVEPLRNSLPDGHYIIGPEDVRGSFAVAYLMENGKTIDKIH